MSPLAGCSSTAKPAAATTTPATTTTATGLDRGADRRPEKTTASIQIGDMFAHGSIGTTAKLTGADGKSLNGRLGQC